MLIINHHIVTNFTLHYRLLLVVIYLCESILARYDHHVLINQPFIYSTLACDASWQLDQLYYCSTIPAKPSQRHTKCTSALLACFAATSASASFPTSAARPPPLYNAHQSRNAASQLVISPHFYIKPHGRRRTGAAVPPPLSIPIPQDTDNRYIYI